MIEQSLIKVDGDLSERFAKLDGDLDQRFGEVNQRFGEVNQRFAKVDGEIRLLRWMIGFNLAGTVGIIFMLLRH